MEPLASYFSYGLLRDDDTHPQVTPARAWRPEISSCASLEVRLGVLSHREYNCACSSETSLSLLHVARVPARHSRSRRLPVVSCRDAIVEFRAYSLQCAFHFVGVGRFDRSHAAAKSRKQAAIKLKAARNHSL